MIKPYWPSHARTLADRAPDPPRAAIEAASISPFSPIQAKAGRGRCTSPCTGPADSSSLLGLGSLPALGQERLGVDRAGERQLAADDLVDPVLRDRRVALGIDAVGAEHALAVLRLEERVDDVGTGDVLRPVRARLLDRVEQQLRRLVAVDGVRIGRATAVLLLVLLEELRALRAEGLRIQRRDRALEPRRGLRRHALLRVGRRVEAVAVALVDLGVRMRRGHGLEALVGVLLDLAGGEEAVRLHVRRKRAVVRRLRVVAVVALHL